MQKITVICVGKLKETFYRDAVSEYTKRLSRYCHLDLLELPETKLSDNPSEGEIQQALQAEAALVKQKIPKGAALIALCIEGKEYSSPELAEQFKAWGNQGVSHLCFLIGSSFGMASTLKQEADCKLSMSPMTFPHHLARIMVLEQIYRSFQILEGGKYHK